MDVKHGPGRPAEDSDGERLAGKRVDLDVPSWTSTPRRAPDTASRNGSTGAPTATPNGSTNGTTNDTRTRPRGGASTGGRQRIGRNATPSRGREPSTGRTRRRGSGHEPRREPRGEPRHAAVGRHRRPGAGKVAVAVAALCAVFSLLVAADTWANGGEVYRGVNVSGVAVGGMEPEEATTAVREGAGLPREVSLRGADGEVATLGAEEIGLKPDAAGSTDAAYAIGREGWVHERAYDRLRALFGGAEAPLEVRYDRDAVREALAVTPQDAGFEISGDEVSVTPAKEGAEVDDAFWSRFEGGLARGQARFEAPMRGVAPELTNAEAERLKPTDLIGSYRTYYANDPDPYRQTNLGIASEAINDTVLAPGEEFSFNAVAEPLDYADAKVIVGGKVDYAEGGGICQVSSTLYAAVTFAGLDVTERHPHYSEPKYIRPGYDAAVWFDDAWEKDMKFTNDTGGYVLIRQWVEADGFLYSQVFGRPTGKTVSLRSEKTAEYEDQEGKPITEWVTYRTVTESGVVTEDALLHEDVYRYLKPADDAEDLAEDAAVESTG